MRYLPERFVFAAIVLRQSCTVDCVSPSSTITLGIPRGQPTLSDLVMTYTKVLGVRWERMVLM